MGYLGAMNEFWLIIHYSYTDEEISALARLWKRITNQFD